MEGPLHRIDQLLCSSLDAVEQRVPSVHLPPDLVSSFSKEITTRSINIIFLPAQIFYNTKEYMSDHLVISMNFNCHIKLVKQQKKPTIHLCYSQNWRWFPRYRYVRCSRELVQWSKSGRPCWTVVYRLMQPIASMARWMSLTNTWTNICPQVLRIKLIVSERNTLESIEHFRYEIHCNSRNICRLFIINCVSFGDRAVATMSPLLQFTVEIHFIEIAYRLLVLIN